MRRFFSYCLTGFLLLLINGFVGYGQQGSEVKGVTIIGDTGITMRISELQKLSDEATVSATPKIREEFEIERHLKNHPSSPVVSSYPFSGPSLNGQGTTQAIHSNFQAISLSESGAVPPDCMGDLSETQVCIASNGRLKFYAKPTICDAPLTTSISSGSASLTAPQFSIDLDVFFNSVRNDVQTTDPHVYYDRLTKRWFIVIINVTTKSNRFLIAVSNTSNITASSSFTFYYFTHDQGTAAGDPDFAKFGDFPMVGLDKDALYIGALIFDADNNSYEGSSCYVVRKSSITSGGPLVFTAFRRVGSSGNGIFAPNPAYNDDPQASHGYYVGVNAANYGVLNYLIVNNPGGTPTLVTGSLTVPVTAPPLNQEAKGSLHPLDGGDDRLLNVQMVKNKLTGTNSIWTAHNVAVTAAGIASSDGNSLRNAIRWYELNMTATSISLKQSGTWYDKTASNAQGYWMGSIAASGQGHALAGASVAGPDKAANVIIAGRYNSQTAGELNSTVFATNFNAEYNLESGDEQRWGDYSQTVIDPSDNMTIWTFQEYTNLANSWGERATQVKAPPPATPSSLTPVLCNDLQSSEVLLTGQSVNNSGFFDPGDDEGGPGFTKHLQISSTGNVTISGIIFDSPTQVRFVVNYAGAPPGSEQTLTITNPDCQFVTYKYMIPSACAGQTTKPITVYPNPTTGNIFIRLNNSGGQLRMLDITGKLMYVQNVTSNFIIVPSARFAKGVYIIEFINGNTKNHEKVLVL